MAEKVGTQRWPLLLHGLRVETGRRQILQVGWQISLVHTYRVKGGCIVRFKKVSVILTGCLLVRLKLVLFFWGSEDVIFRCGFDRSLARCLR